jgi:hypothetical protein
MYNTDLPTRAELPTARQLIRSTIIAILAAIAILISIVLPAEYGIDPTGIGRALGLAEMGEIKQQLAREAEEDRKLDRQASPAPEQRSSLGGLLGQVFIRSAAAQPVAQAAPAMRSDEMSVTLKPGQGTEIKLQMKQGAKVNYVWTATGEVNYDLHGDGSGKETSYKKGRGVARDEGVLTAGFDGNHGWFWRNRTKADVTVTLRTSGDYATIKKMM